MVSDERVDEMIDKFGEMDDAEFEQWIEQQPDADELGKILISLFFAGNPEKNKGGKGDATQS